MGQGFSVVVGMTISYTVSFFGLLLAYIVYQRNHNQDDLWRTRPVGVSFFAAVYGYILPLLLVANAGLTLLIKSFKGWDFNRFIWTDTALIWPIAGVLMFWLIGKLFWRMKSGGYAAAVPLWRCEHGQPEVNPAQPFQARCDAGWIEVCSTDGAVCAREVMP